MPRKKNLDIAEALGEDIDVTETEANDANTIVAPKPPAPAPVASAQPITLTFEQLQSLMASGILTAQSGTQALADALTQGIKQAQPQRPSNERAPDISDANPLGDRDHPRPGLKCAITFGIQDPKTKAIQRTYPFEPDDLTVYEQLALNILEPGEYHCKLYGGAPIKVSVVPERNAATDELTRLVIVIPTHITQRGSEHRNLLPGACDLVQQITGKDFRTLSHDDLAWFMAEHRNKRYVSEREEVAA